MKKFIIFWKTFFMMIWDILKTMKSFKGIMALFISYMIFHGWAVLFVLIGTITNQPWFTVIGSAVILFWLGPGTPAIPIILLVAFMIKRYLFFEKDGPFSIKDKWRELNEKNNKDKKN